MRSYSYDANGNRLSVEDTTSVVATYDDQDRLIMYGDMSYVYGADGTRGIASNLTTVGRWSGARTSDPSPA